MAARSIFWVLLLHGAGVKAASLCFFPGGVQSLDIPCDTSAEVSMCCGSVAACLSNGLCKDGNTTENTGISYARGTCTDPTWQSPICPQNCQLNQDTARNSSAFDFRFNGVQVWECDGKGFGVPADYCCESASEKTRCCSTQTALFTLNSATPGNALAVQTFHSAATTSAAVKTTTVASGTSATAAQTTTSSTSKASSTSTTSSSEAAITPVAESSFASLSSNPAVSVTTAPTNAGNSIDSNTTPSGGGLSTGSVVAIGVGASMSGAVLVASAVIIILRLTKSGKRFGGGGSGSNTFSSSFYGGPPIYAPAKPEMAQRDDQGYHERRQYASKMAGLTQIRTTGLGMQERPVTGSSPMVSHLESGTSPKRPGSRIYELA